MWPFKSVKPLKESGMFAGYVDWHSHILPGVDDGISTMEGALEVLRHYEELGFRKVWLTPHVMEDYPNTTTFLRERFLELKSNWDGNLELRLASENMLDNLFEERLAAKDFLPIGDDGTHLLVETSYYTPPMGMADMLEAIRGAGYFPILAHPERYRYMEEKDYRELKKQGVFFQINFISLVGGYGETAKKKAEWLLLNDMVDLTGSDIHRLDAIKTGIVNKPGGSKIVQKLQDVISECCL